MRGASIMESRSKKQRRVRVLKSGGQVQVWFYPGGAPRTLAGAVNADLAADARRYGQDLVDELIERALWMADRHSVDAGDRR